MGILFFIWVGIFNYFVIAQFWGFANDLYSDEAGKRTFPLVALGATLGGLIATLPFMKKLRDRLGGNWQFKLMLIAGVVLGLCIVLARIIHRRDVRRTCEDSEKGVAGAAAKACVQEQPLEAGGGFRLVFKSRYLLLIALMIGLYNFVNATGEFIMSDVTVRRSIAASERRGRRPGGRSGATAATASPALPAKTESKAIHNAFMDYQFWTNLVALVIQLFLVSRIFRWVGVGGALLFLPLIALGGYALISFGAVLRSSCAGSRSSRTGRTIRSRTRPRPRCSWSPSGRRSTRPRRPSTPSSSGAATPSPRWPSSWAPSSWG